MGGVAASVLPYGFEFSLGAVIAVTLVSIVSAIETVGDASATTKAGAGRDATDAEIKGATYADGLGTAVAGVFGGLPNTSFSQNVGIVGMTGVMSRHVVTIAGSDPDRLWFVAKNRCGYRVDAIASIGWRCDRDVRYGCSGWFEHVDRS